LTSINAMQDATAAANISDGLVQGSLPLLEPKEYNDLFIMPLVVVIRPSPVSGLPVQVAVALRIMGTSACYFIFILYRSIPL
jgi:hypothetical protein